MEKEKNEGERVMEITPEILDKIHACGQEILDEFVRICEENHLKYYLIAGTLLGAVRHKGPIPWDDDVDVCMPREDFEKFKKIMLARPEGELYHIHCRENDVYNPRRHAKLMKRDTVYYNQFRFEEKVKYLEMWIDIFPLDDGPEKINWRYKLNGWKLRKVYSLLCTKLSRRKKLGFKHRMIRIFLIPIPRKLLVRYDEKLMRKYENQESHKYVSWASHYHFIKQTMPKEWYDPMTKVLYNKKYYSAPGQWDKVLGQLYGDYMTPPPQEKRTGHNAINVKI